MQRANLIRERRYKAERRLPVRLTIGLPPHGLGQALNEMSEWLDAALGRDGYAWVPAGLRGVDATHLYLPDLERACAFAARWPVLGLETARKDAPLGGSGAGKEESGVRRERL